MTDDQRTRLRNAAGNIQHDGLTLQIAAKRGDSVEELRHLFDVVKDSWECLAEVWQEIDGTPDLDQPLTIEWLDQHLRHAGTLWDERLFCFSVGEWEVSANLKSSVPHLQAARSSFFYPHRRRQFRIEATQEQPITIRDAIGLLKLAGVPLKGVEL